LGHCTRSLKLTNAHSDENEDNWDPPSAEEMLSREKEATGKSEDYKQPPERRDLHERWRRTREPIQIQPPAFEDIKVDYDVHPDATLRHKFKNSGLQIIVKLASIELSPEKPEFPPGGWHVEGQMNEHIVATSLYYLDSENITESHLEFRAQTDLYQNEKWDVGQDGYHWMESVYGVVLGGTGSPCLQHYGSVVTREGRLLAFPNVFHHRVSGFKLADPSKPGHRRFIALWLVDPLTRIINTGNVPPQQAEWWEESAFGSLGSKGGTGAIGTSTTMPPEIAALLLENGLGKRHLEGPLAKGELGLSTLPNEVLDMVREDFGDFLPMTREQAEQHRLDLMKARSAFTHKAKEGWNGADYSFCEH